MASTKTRPTTRARPRGRAPRSAADRMRLDPLAWHGCALPPYAARAPRRCAPRPVVLAVAVAAVQVKELALVAAVGVHDPDGPGAPRLETKAIDRPSGDQVGNPSWALWFVRRVRPLPSLDAVHLPVAVARGHEGDARPTAAPEPCRCGGSSAAGSCRRPSWPDRARRRHRHSGCHSHGRRGGHPPSRRDIRPRSGHCPSAPTSTALPNRSDTMPRRVLPSPQDVEENARLPPSGAQEGKLSSE
jgi:hypothetical protein